jgi:hypothetical protein
VTDWLEKMEIKMHCIVCERISISIFSVNPASNQNLNFKRNKIKIWDRFLLWYLSWMFSEIKLNSF